MRAGVSILTRAKNSRDGERAEWKKKGRDRRGATQLEQSAAAQSHLGSPERESTRFSFPMCCLLCGGEGSVIGMFERCCAKLKLCDNSVAC